MKRAAKKATVSYRDELLRALKDAGEASRYLDEAFDDEDPRVFLLALRDVAEAQGGMSRLSRRAGLNRENLYRMLSKRGNPELIGLSRLLGAMGLRLAVRPA